MKRSSLLLFIMFVTIQLQAQLINGNFTTEVDERIKSLNKASITSNILIDRVFPVAGIQAFNQETRRDTSSVAHFKQAWSELYRASYNKNFASIESFKQQLKDKNYGSNIVPIGIINTEFHQCNFGTTAQNANVDFNPTTGLFTNKSNKNPFIKKQTTIIAPLVNKVSGNTITFTTDNLFKLHKVGKRIKNLQLYTNNTSFVLINNYNLVNSSFTTSYPNTSLQILRFVITFSDNTTKTTYGKVKIIKPVNIAYRNNVSSVLDSIEADDDLLFQGYDENQAYRGKNKYRIYYSDNNQMIDKPLYIIDGYDPNNSRKIQPSDYENYDSNNDKSIIELMQYKNNNNETISLIDSLNFKGYDVIIVNHPVYNRGAKKIDGGSDYIERNAFTFISLLRHIKNIQQGNEKAVVIGPSMGGLISRYALAYMEKKYVETGNEKWNHNTRLWVSFDAPHQGANIPIGVQKGIQYFAEELEVEGAKEFINEELNKPAPKQMLVNHYTNNTSLPVGSPNFRNRFQNALNNLGMPKNLRKIALLNGSIFGKLNGISSAKNLEIRDDLNHLSIFTPLNLISNTFADELLANFYNTTNKKSGGNETFTFDGGIRGSFLWWSWWTTRTNYKSKPKFTGSYDIAPGGHFNAQELLVNETTNPETDFTWYLLNWTFHNLNSNLIDPTHSFIPTKSSLAYTGSNVLDEYLADQNLVCSNKTPFDSYYAPNDNQEHIYLTNENVSWLTKEIMGIPQEPSIFIDSPIEGEAYVCHSNNNNYTIALPCQISSQWSVSNNLIITSQTSNSITVKPVNNLTQGHGYIKSKVGSNFTVKNIWIGKPRAYTRYPDPTICTNVFLQQDEYKLPVSPGATTYRLTSNSSYLYVDDIVYPGHRIDMIASRPGSYRITLTTENSCGTKQATIYVTAQDCGSGGGFPALFRAYPNPVSETLTIKNIVSKEKIMKKVSLMNANNMKISDRKSYYEIYNFGAKFIERGILKDLNHIDVSRYKKGNYIIRISTDGKIESHIFVVN